MNRTEEAKKLQHYLHELFTRSGYKSDGKSCTERPCEYTTPIYSIIISMHTEDMVEIRLYNRNGLAMVFSALLYSIENFKRSDVLIELKNYL